MLLFCVRIIDINIVRCVGAGAQHRESIFARVGPGCSLTHRLSARTSRP